ncbi:MAG: DUF1465 family protein, partial [Caulobacteraceae bacterium]
DSKLLSRSAALAYAAQSMRLTTRLMQVASWLLIQKAVCEGEMAPEAACQASYRLHPETDASNAGPMREPLPLAMRSLLDRSARLFERVRHLDRRVYVETQGVDAPSEQPVLAQLQRLKGAFEVS